MRSNFFAQIRFLKHIGGILALIVALGQPLNLYAAEDQVKIIPNLQAPDPPTTLSQMTPDNTKPLPVGGSMGHGEFVASSLIRDPDPEDSLVIEVEVRPVGVAFLNQPNYASPAIKSFGSAMIIPILIGGLPEGRYHWQERVKDAAGHVTVWRPFGSNDEDQADLIVDQTPPVPPTDVRVVGGVKTSTITWSRSPSEDVRFIDILRGTTTDTVTSVIAEVDASQTSYTDAGLQDGNIYWYSVRAKDAAGNLSGTALPASVITDSVIDDTTGGKVVLTGVWGEVTGLDPTLATNGTFRWAPGDSEATASYTPTLPTAGQYEVRVSWVVNPPNFIGRQASNAPYVVTDATGQKLTSVDQSKLADGSTSITPAWSGWHSLGVYTAAPDKPFMVTLIARANGYVNTDASRFVSIRPLGPKNVSALDHPDDNGEAIDVRWEASPSTTVNRYKIYRATQSGAFDFNKPLAEVIGFSYVDTTAAAGQTYYYLITASDGTRESLPTPERQVMALDNRAPLRPTELNITDGDGVLMLVWPKVVEAARYELTIKRVDTGEIVSVTTLLADQTSTKIVGLTNGQTYTVDLVAIDGAGNRSPFIGVVGQPKTPVTEPVKPTITRPTAVAKAMARPAKQKLEARQEQKPTEPSVEAKPSPEKEKPEGEVKGAQNERPVQNRTLVTILILAIAIIVGVGGYYGYDWWFGKAGESMGELPQDREDAKPEEPVPPSVPPDRKTDHRPEEERPTKGRW